MYQIWFMENNDQHLYRSFDIAFQIWNGVFEATHRLCMTDILSFVLVIANIDALPIKE